VNQTSETKREWLVKGIYLSISLVVLFLFIKASQIFFLALAGYIFFLFLNSIVTWLTQKTPMGYNLALGIAVTALFLLFAGYWIYLAPVLSDQFNQFVQKIPELKSRLVGLLDSYVDKKVLQENLSLK
jgi:predicted PurR-regulated permease PerM